jgi:hypothetical protein
LQAKQYSTCFLGTINLAVYQGYERSENNCDGTVQIRDNETHHVDFTIEFQQLNPNKVGEPISYCENPVMIVRIGQA